MTGIFFKGSQEKRGGSRDCKVREAGGLDPPMPPLTAAMEEDTIQTSRQSRKWRIFHI